MLLLLSCLGYQLWYILVCVHIRYHSLAENIRSLYLADAHLCKHCSQASSGRLAYYRLSPCIVHGR
jgi:hypothetical protein